MKINGKVFPPSPYGGGLREVGNFLVEFLGVVLVDVNEWPNLL